MKTEKIFISDLADEFVSVKAGDPFRLFKYGDIYKGGKKHTISKDKPIKLPHFRAPIKLGSHKDETPAGGFLTGLEYREDGVYAVPEWNEEGTAALEKGAYRYHSPEMIWEGWELEDSQTGKTIEGPIVVGVALTHTPALGETTALYTYEQEKKIMGEQVETVAVPKDFWEGFKDFFTIKKEEKPEEPEEDNRDEFEAAMQERDEYKARVEAFEAEKEQAELYTAIRKEFEVDEFGDAFKAIADEDGAVEMLAKMDEEVRKWVVEKFAAMSAQKEIVTEELGEDAPLPEGVDGFAAKVEAYKEENKVDYATAAKAVAKENPELFAAYKGGK